MEPYHNGNHDQHAMMDATDVPFVPIPHKHNDLVHSIAYDYYGTTIATASSDQTVRIFTQASPIIEPSDLPQKMEADPDNADPNKEWEFVADWKAHDASILKVQFLHPTFGTALVTTSLDRTLKIWECLASPRSVRPSFQPTHYLKRWKLVYTFTPPATSTFNQSYTYIPCFSLSAPPQLRLTMLLSTSQVLVLEAPDPSDLSKWELTASHLLPPPLLPSPPGRDVEPSFAISECPSKGVTVAEYMICSALDVVRIFTYDGTRGAWLNCMDVGGHKGLIRDVAWAPTAGRSYHLFATAGKDGHVRIYKFTPTARPKRLTAQEWLTKKKTVSSITGGGSKPGLGIGGLIRREEALRRSGVSPPKPSPPDLLQRQYSYTAPASPTSFSRSSSIESSPSSSLKEKSPIGLQFGQSNTSGSAQTTQTGLAQIASSSTDSPDTSKDNYPPETGGEIELLADLDDHRREVWRVCWNVTGSILSSAGDDGKIRLWRKAANGRWMVISIINHSDSDDTAEDSQHNTGSVGHHLTSMGIGGAYGMGSGGGGMFSGGLQGGSVQTVPEEDE
ncbi:WD40 repeat-like protein [Ascobolus immersus RN42]|uniref:WD40 repeat-like protein n=1 Tax=Ascobolus immersus RN42 TaxID=1160509 RepID=A0A3N4IPT5_ASCIM|nr:WD40 repeat-like protein [Ascobolus immersus RN42]